MPGQAVIGALRVDLTLDTASFQRGVTHADKQTKALGKRLEGFGTSVGKVGAAMSVGITLPFAALMKTAIPAAIESRNALGQVEAALKSMGPVAQRTSEQLQGQARALQALSTFDDDDILTKVTANLLTFGNVSGEVFDRAQRAIVDISARMGTDLQASAIMVGKALNDPAKGLAALRRVGIQFTAQQQEQIKAMAAAGNAAGAQAIMLKELERQFGGAAAAAQAANPGDAARDAWHDFQETVGDVALNVLPPLTTALTGVLNAFNKLSPQVQTVAVGAVAVAAALGPVTTLAGGLIIGLGKLAPLLVSLGASLLGAGSAAGTVTTFMAGLGAVLLPIAAAAGAAYLAWKNWDTIWPILQKVGKAIWDAVGPTVMGAVQGISQAASDLFNGPFGSLLKMVLAQLADFGKVMAYVFGPVILAAIRGLVQLVAETFKTIVNILNTVAAFLSGDFSGAWEGAKATVGGVISGIGRIFEAVFPGAIAWLRRLYEGAKTWLVDKMTALVELVLQPIRQIEAGFKWLWDRVVGHSHIPDMVDKIAAHMARLDAVMVKPATKAAKATAEAFKQLADEVGPLLDRLFPEAATKRQFLDEMALIDRAEKAGEKGGGLSKEMAEEARRRLLREGSDEYDPKLEGWEEPELAGVDRAEAQLDRMMKNTFPDWEKRGVQAASAMVIAFADMAEGIVNSIRNVTDAFENGSFLDKVLAVLDVVKQAVGAYLQIKGGGPSMDGPGGGGGVFSGFPGFAQGGSFQVGGRSGVDKNLVAFRATKGERVDITKPGQSFGARRLVFDLRGAVMTQDLLRQMESMADGAAVRGAEGGALKARTDAIKAAKRRLR
jgi:hypothetical protein